MGPLLRRCAVLCCLTTSLTVGGCGSAGNTGSSAGNTGSTAGNTGSTAGNTGLTDSSTSGSAGEASGTAALGAVRTVDIEAHRGGAGETSESTLPGFQHAMTVGVTTLELDTHITKDLVVVINHDNDVNAAICKDTAPVTTGDPEYPYAGKLIKDLTLAQLSTLDCGSMRSPDHPDQQLSPGAKIVQLRDLFALTKKSGDSTIRFNIEIKIDGDKLDESVPRQQFAMLLQQQISAAGMTKRVTIQSFDWPSLVIMHSLDASLPLVALSTGIGDGLVSAATKIVGLSAISPKFGDLTPEMVQAAHAAKLKVIPWTVDSEADMASVLAMGVDGVITNNPTMLRNLLQRNAFPVPAGI